MTSLFSLSKCRVCFCVLDTTNGCYDLQKIPKLAHKFIACTDLSLIEEERLPSELCQVCYDQLEQFYDFRVRCIEADAKWRMEILFCNDDERLNYKSEPAESEVSPLVQDAEQPCRGKRKKRKLRGCTQDQYIEAPALDIHLNDSQINNEQSSKQTGTGFICDICSMRFMVEHRLQAHKRQHEGLIPYPCTEPGCDRAFTRLYCLTEHKKLHTGISNWFSCQQEGCNKRYRHKPTLMMHMRKLHKLGPELKSHVCEFCGKVFNSSAVLNDHRYTHKDKSELPYACQEADCSRRFSTKEKLKVHMMRHAGIKNFSCSYCGMRKTTRNELKIHMNYHTLERTWSCRFCTKVCNSSGNLKMHIRSVHERARDYACSYCERRFAKPDTRKYHEMTHTGEKPHECDECGKRFTQPAALRTHRKIHERQRKESESKTVEQFRELNTPSI